jgi:putative oxidoreductase
MKPGLLLPRITAQQTIERKGEATHAYSASIAPDSTAIYSSSMNRIDVAVAILRGSVGVSIAYHGINKAKSITGTASWFKSIGMKWPKQQAAIAASTEIIAGALLVVGLATPLSCIAVIALMTVAIVTVHARVGYFIFLPNGGWEYCASIAAIATAIAITGPGALSVDDAWGLNQSLGLVALPIGLMCALCHLALCWRPQTNNPSA